MSKRYEKGGYWDSPALASNGGGEPWREAALSEGKAKLRAEKKCRAVEAILREALPDTMPQSSSRDAIERALAVFGDDHPPPPRRPECTALAEAKSTLREMNPVVVTAEERAVLDACAEAHIETVHIGWAMPILDQSAALIVAKAELARRAAKKGADNV